MQTPEEIKLLVKEKYGAIAAQDTRSASSCCGGEHREPPQQTFSIMADEYSSQMGYAPEADLGLGCGLPTAFASIEPGMTVLDLGSGAGNDAFIAAQQVGETGHVIGVDMTPEMIARANENKRTLGMEHVEFRLGDIERLPVDDATIDVALSNCVLNLVPDKDKAFAEIARVLRPGGHFTVSDIVLEGTLSPALLNIAELYVGCVAGALQKTDYLACIARAGFEHISILTEKEIVLPEDIMTRILGKLPEAERTIDGAKVFSITVTGRKP